MRAALASAPQLIDEVVDALSAEAASARLLELAFDILGTSEETSDPGIAATAASMMGKLLPALREVVEAIFESHPVPLSAEAVKILRDIDCAASLEVEVYRARLLHASGDKIEDDLRRILEVDGDIRDETISTTVDAVDLAEESGNLDLVAAALSHRFADVRHRALAATAARSEAPLSQDLLKMVEDKGSRVRRQLVNILEEKRHPDHVSTLIRLSGDEWSDQQYHYEDPANYPIAVHASKILMTEAIADEHVDAIAKIVRKTKDQEVQTNLLQALVRNGSESTRNRVLRLALKTGSPPLHRLATIALIREAENITGEEANKISDSQLRTRVPAVAVRLALLLGLRADGVRVVAAAQALREVPDRQALAVPLILGAYQQGNELGVRVRSQLPLKLQEWCSDLPNTFPDLTASDLQDFGEIRLVQAVAALLKADRANS